MNELSLSAFTDPADNLNSRKQQIDQQLGHIQKNFDKNILFPELNQLVCLCRDLSDELDKISPMRINGKVSPDQLNRMENTRELVQWSSSRILRLVESGRTIFDFVCDQITLRWLSEDRNRNEGYVIIPGPESSHEQYAYRYTLYFDTDHVSDQPLLRTRQVDTFCDEASKSVILNQLCAEKSSPVLMVNSTDMYPWNSTFLPAVRREMKPYIINTTNKTL